MKNLVPFNNNEELIVKKNNKDALIFETAGSFVLITALILFFIEKMFWIGLWLISFGIFIILIGLLNLFKIESKRGTISILLIFAGFLITVIPIAFHEIITKKGILFAIIPSLIALILLIIIIKYERRKNPN